MSAPVTVRVFKYDGSQHRLWSATLAERRDNLIILDAKFAEEVNHDLLGRIERGTSSTEYYWLDRWYNVFRFSDGAGELRNFYCNVNMPPTFDGATLSYIDLDIDVLVAADYAYKILDLEEFEQNAARYDYSVEVREAAHRSLAELVSLIEQRQFPFFS